MCGGNFLNSQQRNATSKETLPKKRQSKKKNCSKRPTYSTKMFWSVFAPFPFAVEFLILRGRKFTFFGVVK